MKRALILLFVFTAMMSQDLKLRGIFVSETALNYFGAGADYKLSKIDDMTVFGTGNFIYGSKNTISQSIFELGGTLRKQLNDDFYVKGGTLLSFITTKTDAIDLGIFGKTPSVSNTDTKLTFLVGVGYLINKQFSVVLDYGLTGADIFRIQLGFDL